MNDDESFLARWSRRKRTVAVQSDAKADPPPSAEESLRPVFPTADEFPPAMPLPPIKSIEAASDIKAFLAPDVPLELTRAALRRAWTADPVIRDFVGLSENAWDFNDPDGVPGFGSLSIEDVRRLATQLFGEPHGTDRRRSPRADDTAMPADAAAAIPIAEVAQSTAGARLEDDERKPRESRPRHHGGALPQ